MIQPEIIVQPTYIYPSAMISSHAPPTSLTL